MGGDGISGIYNRGDVPFIPFHHEHDTPLHLKPRPISSQAHISKTITPTHCMILFTHCMILFTHCMILFTHCMILFTHCMILFTHCMILFIFLLTSLKKRATMDLKGENYEKTH